MVERDKLLHERRGRPCPFCNKGLVKKNDDIIFMHCEGKVSEFELVNKIYEALGSNKIHGKYLRSIKFVSNGKSEENSPGAQKS